MPIVVDTSVALKWVRIEVHTAQAEALRDNHLRRRDTMYVPSLLVSEVTSGLYRFARDGSLTQTEVMAGLDEILAVEDFQKAMNRNGLSHVRLVSAYSPVYDIPS
jgi:predicted nucleic acid-binding protein